MAIEQEIRIWARRYLDGVVSFTDFEDWFLDATWDEQADLESVPELVHMVDRYISEYTGGHRSEAQLREAFEALAPSWAVADNTRLESMTAGGRLIPAG